MHSCLYTCTSNECCTHICNDSTYLNSHLCSSYGVLLWLPTYVGEITAQQKLSEFDAKCHQNVTDFSAKLLPDYCDCSNTNFQDTFIVGARIESWVISDVTFSNVTFRDVTFDNVIIRRSSFLNNCVFQNCTIKHSQFITTGFSSPLSLNLNVSSSFLCDLRGVTENDTFIVTNSSINGNLFNRTASINGSIFDGDNSTCINQIPDFGIKCDQSEKSTVYRDSFIISASSVTGYVVSAIAVYLFRRNYWLGEYNIAPIVYGCVK